MPASDAQEVKNDILNRYEERTPKARLLDAEARKYFSGGHTRNSAYFAPYPVYMVRGRGCRTEDADGNAYLDFCNNYTSLIHGHLDPDIVAAVQDQLEKGTEFATPTRLQIEHAAHMTARLPSAEMIRYCNSGTEATLWTIKMARAATGRDKIVKMEGGYHGTHDIAKVSLTPDPEQKHPPVPRLDGPGVPRSVLQDVLVAPFNDLDTLEQLLKTHHDELAAVIAEPMLGSLGMVPPAPGYLAGLRALTEKYGVLLIFDEVITFRLSPGGMQAREGIEPDLTALAKIIGGGFPVGAFAGPRRIMDRFDPRTSGGQAISHAGTFNGNPITMAAGLAALRKYDAAAAGRINALGDRLRAGFDRAFQKAGLKGRATGLGSLAQVHFGDHAIRTAYDFAAGMLRAGEAPRLFHLEMINRGVFSAGRGMFVVSTPMTEKEIDQAVEASAAALEMLKIYAVEAAPHLMA
jgi:glutamate-1-semialdehyde 2,1-aminomutase